MYKFRRIVYVLNDHSSELSASFLNTVNLAKANQADLTVLRILPEIPTFVLSQLFGVARKNLEENMLEQENTRLHRIIASIDPALHAKAELRIGKTHIEIIRAVQANSYDLVAKEIDDIDWLKLHFGSDDMHLLRNCPCPVWLIKHNEGAELKNIIAAVDFDDELEIRKYSYNDELNQKILDMSASLSLSGFTTLHVVNTYDVPEAGFVAHWVDHPEKVKRELFQAKYQIARQNMDALMENLGKKLGTRSFDFLSPCVHIVEGPPDRELPKIAESVSADLVIMGTVGRSGIAGVIIGNTAETILSQLQCSVLAIKPSGFISPIS